MVSNIKSILRRLWGGFGDGFGEDFGGLGRSWGGQREAKRRKKGKQKGKQKKEAIKEANAAGLGGSRDGCLGLLGPISGRPGRAEERI